MTPLQRNAMRRMLTGIDVPTRDHGPVDPVAHADAMTSMADARAALCIARGVPLEHIDRLGYHRRPR